MITVLLVIHIILAILLVIVILLQRSEGGALGMGGGMSSFMSGRAVGNLLTKLTAIFATCFFITSLTLAILVDRKSKTSKEESIIDELVEAQEGQTEGTRQTEGAAQTMPDVPTPQTTDVPITK